MSIPRLMAEKLFTTWKEKKNANDIFPVDCIEIAKSLGIKVTSNDFKQAEFTGALFHKYGINAIIFNSNIKEEGRKQFTIAHELGHYHLHFNSSNSTKPSSIENAGVIAQTSEGKKQEKEANEFAACLLMPSEDMAPKLSNKVDMNLVIELSKRYGTSITATACRIVSLHEKPVGVVMLSKDNTTLWCYRNNHFRDFFIKKGKKINLESHATQEQRECNADLWLEKTKTNWKIKTSSIEMEEYNKRLYIITGEPNNN